MADSLLTIGYPDGNVIALRLPALTDDDRAAVAAAIAETFGELTYDQERALLLMLAEDIHEGSIYEKVAQQRGVLAL